MNRTLAVLALAAVCSPGLLAAQSDTTPCAPGSLESLRVVAYALAQPQPPQLLPLPPARFAIATWKDRRILGSTMVLNGDDRLALLTQLESGTITKAAWDHLGALGATAHIGALRGCNTLLPLAQVNEAKVTWCGAGTRKNSFVLSSVDDSLPACAPEVRDWLYALLTLELEPGAETSSLP